jgi:hypothetical protein
MRQIPVGPTVQSSGAFRAVISGSDQMGSIAVDEDVQSDEQTSPEPKGDALARAAALGPLPGIDDEAAEESEKGAELTPDEEETDFVNFNLRG